MARGRPPAAAIWRNSTIFGSDISTPWPLAYMLASFSAAFEWAIVRAAAVVPAGGASASSRGTISPVS